MLAITQRSFHGEDALKALTMLEQLALPVELNATLEACGRLRQGVDGTCDGASLRERASEYSCSPRSGSRHRGRRLMPSAAGRALPSERSQALFGHYDPEFRARFHRHVSRPIADPVRKRCAIGFDAFTCIDAGLPVQWKVIAVFSDEDMRQKPCTGLATFDGQRRHRRLHHALTAPARERRADVLDHFEVAGNVIQYLGDILTHLAHFSPPQAGQVQLGSCTTSRRGRCSGKGLRPDLLLYGR